MQRRDWWLPQGRAFGGLGEKVRRDWEGWNGSYKQSCGLDYSIGAVVYNIIITVQCQVDTGNIRGTVYKVCDCLTTMLYTGNYIIQNILNVNFCWK